METCHLPVLQIWPLSQDRKFRLEDPKNIVKESLMRQNLEEWNYGQFTLQQKIICLTVRNKVPKGIMQEGGKDLPTCSRKINTRMVIHLDDMLKCEMMNVDQRWILDI